MNKNIFLLVILLITLCICSYNVSSNKNKFRIQMLFDGILNKIIVLFFIIVTMIENYQIGILLMLGFFTIYIQMKLDNPKIMEGFVDYFEK